MTDWTKLRHFDIVWCEYQFEGDPEPQSKYFVVAYNVTSLKLVRCFKPTSKTRFYDAEPIRLSGVVQYNAGEIAGLNEPRTIIDPERTYDISYDALRRSECNGQFHLVGKMPADFATRMIAAVNGKKEWRQRQRRDFLSWFPTQD